MHSARGFAEELYDYRNVTMKQLRILTEVNGKVLASEGDANMGDGRRTIIARLDSVMMTHLAQLQGEIPLRYRDNRVGAVVRWWCFHVLRSPESDQWQRQALRARASTDPESHNDAAKGPTDDSRGSPSNG